MSIELYGLFAAACILLVATPGPNVALIVGTSLRYGARRGLATVAGVNCGLILQLAVVAAGLAWIVELFARHFDVIRYIGVAYLVFLGLQQLLAREVDGPTVAPPISRERAFARGLAVAFANPKTLVFTAAFLPQFLSGAEGSRWELWVLAVTYALIGAVGDSLWALFAARARAAVSGRAQRVADKVSGVILLGGAAVLLAARR
ncbi:MAG: LysE family translocator [Rhizobiales bacterium]|nr:LysE family translocator [Hyphomicrobiales bacterium]